MCENMIPKPENHQIYLVSIIVYTFTTKHCNKIISRPTPRTYHLPVTFTPSSKLFPLSAIARSRNGGAAGRIFQTAYCACALAGQGHPAAGRTAEQRRHDQSWAGCGGDVIVLSVTSRHTGTQAAEAGAAQRYCHF